jgi:hypothetical protein
MPGGGEDLPSRHTARFGRVGAEDVPRTGNLIAPRAGAATTGMGACAPQAGWRDPWDDNRVKLAWSESADFVGQPLIQQPD